MRGVLVVWVLVAANGCGATKTTTAPSEPQPFGGTGAVAHGGAGAGGTAGEFLGIETLPGEPPTALPEGPLTAVVKSDGCGRELADESGQTYFMLTHGEKAADCADKLEDGRPVCGAWTRRRFYSIYLPQPYDPERAYPLVFEGMGCGSGTKDGYPLNGNVINSIVRVAIAPGPNTTGHGTNPGQGCFDDKEGDDSIDWVFYENLYDRLNADLCFDRSRVFAVGHSSGAWLANELGCKYAGDALRPVRGVGAHHGGLPTEPAFVPTCSASPMAGFWVHNLNDTTTPFSNAKVAIARAMKLAQCSPGDSYDNATFAPFPVGGGVDDAACQRIQGCDPLYPLVVCALPGVSFGSNDQAMNNGVSTFIKLFSFEPLITP